MLFYLALIASAICFIGMVAHVIIPKRSVPNWLISVVIGSAFLGMGLLVANGITWIVSHLCY